MKTILSFFLAATCAVAQETAPSEAPELITVRVGETVTVSLNGNPTTGYTWNLAEPMKEDAPVLVTMAYGPVPDEDEENPCCGAPCPTLVKMTGVHAGAASFTLEYKRVWETDRPAWKTRTFVVTVEK